MSQAILGILRGVADTLQVIQEMGDKEYLSKKQFDGKLFKEISAEFSGNAVQISHIVPSGKTFYLVSAKLYPVVDTIKTGIAPNNTVVTSNRRADVELEFDGTLIDVLTHDMESTQGSASVTNVAQGQGNASSIGQYDTNIIDSFDGDGIKVVELTSTNTSGTYRVSLMGFEEDTGTDPTILASSITVDASVAGDTGDLVFLQERILSGNTFEVTGDINALNDTIEFIVPNGKTAFLLDAKITISDHPNAASRGSGGTTNQKDIVSGELKIDGVIKDKTTIGESTAAAVSGTNQDGGGSGSGYGNLGDGKFNVKTLSLVGDGIKVIEIENILDDGTATATMSGYLIDT